MCDIITAMWANGYRRIVKDRSVVITAILLVLIMVLAAGLRFFRIDAQSLWYDEGFSVFLARLGLGEITSRTAADIQPPLYYYLLSLWLTLLGDSELALRGLSALFGFLTVPLIYAVGWELFRRRLAGLLAAFVLAIAPLHIWYGQEIRMYTLLTLLCLLSSYLLLRVVRITIHPPASEGGKGHRREILLWIGFALTSVLALYTHYFAILVLAFQAIYILAVWWGGDLQPMRLALAGGLSFLTVAVAYAPWLPHLIARYGVDASYWPGTLKVPEVLVDIAVFLVGGESVPEPVGVALAIISALIFLICLVAIILDELHITDRADQATPTPSLPIMPESPNPQSPTANPKSEIGTPESATPYPTLFLLLYLLLPPILILIISYGTPKFNARYVMVSHPALLLVVAGGLASLLRRRPGRAENLLRWALAALSLLFIVGVAVFANGKAYGDPVFSRADYRGAARHIRRHIEEGESVILTSGHMYPVFDYYAPNVDRHLLPDSPTLDTSRTLDYSIAGQLNDWLAGQTGVWVVLWQDEVVDPVGYLTTMLGDAGEEQPVDADFAQLDVKHYRLPPGTEFSDRPDIDHPARFDFGDRLLLHGYDQTGDREVTLYWEALRPLDQDYRMSLVLRDTSGQTWGQTDGRPSAYLYPTDRWRVGQVVPGQYDLVPMPGTPPGDYGLEVGVYTEADPVGLDILDDAGAAQGKRAMLGAVRLSVPRATEESVEVRNPVDASLDGGLALLGWELDNTEAQPGDRVRLTLAWSARSQPQGDYAASILVTDATGQTFDAGAFPPTNIWHPTSTWLAGQAWRGQNTFRLPVQAKPGPALLSVQLVDEGGRQLGPVAQLGNINVMPTNRAFTPPQPQVSRPANFDDRIALVGADLGTGNPLQVTLYWQALKEMDIPYTVFVHLLGSDGQVIAGHDGQPVSGTRPTTGWVPGEYLADTHDIGIPGETKPGYYVIEVGLYDAAVPGLPRLPIVDENGQPVADRVIFGPVHAE